jgi:cysteinyl-tRNA synthetase
MAHAYLGESFDIHGGGLDLMFPHHENEIAQSRAAGYDFAQTWLHNSWVTQSGEKMSKSLGNSLIVSDVLNRVRGIELRWYLLSAHYRSKLEFSDDAMFDQAAAFNRITGFIERSTSMVGEISLDDVVLDAAFVAAMNDDLALPQAYAVIHENVSEGNLALATSNLELVKAKLRQVRKMLHILGVDPIAWNDKVDTMDDYKDVVEKLVATKIIERSQAREHKDWKRADQIRDELEAAGIVLDDTPDGTRWSISKDEDGR